MKSLESTVSQLQCANYVNDQHYENSTANSNEGEAVGKEKQAAIQVGAGPELTSLSDRKPQLESKLSEDQGS